MHPKTGSWRDSSCPGAVGYKVGMVVHAAGSQRGSGLEGRQLPKGGWQLPQVIVV